MGSVDTPVLRIGNRSGMTLPSVVIPVKGLASATSARSYRRCPGISLRADPGGRLRGRNPAKLSIMLLPLAADLDRDRHRGQGPIEPPSVFAQNVALVLIREIATLDHLTGRIWKVS